MDAADYVNSARDALLELRADILGCLEDPVPEDMEYEEYAYLAGRYESRLELVESRLGEVLKSIDRAFRLMVDTDEWLMNQPEIRALLSEMWRDRRELGPTTHNSFRTNMVDAVAQKIRDLELTDSHDESVDWAVALLTQEELIDA